MYYETLQIPSTATADQIKKQYRKLSLQTHPDRKGGNAELFKRLTEAYEVLSDEGCRRKYDMTRSPASSPSTSSAPSDVSVEITLDQAFTGCAVPFQTKGETCYVDIPAGVDTNEVLHVQRHDGPVKIRVMVKNATMFERNGLDLYYTHPITLKEALCGVSFDIHYFQGQTLKLSTKGLVLSPTYKKILPNKGMKRDKNCGSLTIGFRIEFPNLSLAQINSLEQIL
jgi:DnaJ-class molecular chaperone